MSKDIIRDAVELYAIAYNGASLYRATNKRGEGDQAMRRWIDIAERYNEYKESQR